MSGLYDIGAHHTSLLRYRDRPTLILPATDESIETAAAALAAGRLVGMPTETVYGLAANAWDAAAVAKIFAAKSRPPTNPLIVHVAGLDRLGEAIGWPPERLIRQQIDALVDLWPGPLSLVCPRSDRLPANVTAGLPTVAVRIPDHPVALALLRACRFPLAAPSANRSCYISPTRPEHVGDAAALRPHLACVLDGGPATHGVESTIVLLGRRPRLLRPGSITAETIAQRLRIDPSDLTASSDLVLPGEAAAATGGQAAAGQQSLPASSISPPPLLAPGMMQLHYAPRTPLVLLPVRPEEPELLADVAAPSDTEPSLMGRIGRIAFSPLPVGQAERYAVVETLSDDGDLARVAHHLFAALRRLDACGLEQIHCDTCPPRGVGLAIMDRLRRAAARR